MAKAQIMGILNVTPDSFFAGSRAFAVDQAVNLALKLAEDGADILDIGGESTRPGSSPVSEEEELRRVIPVLKGLKGKLSIPISIDTTKPSVAKAAINAGATLINDITGFINPEMLKIAKESDLQICVMHMQGTPKTMQQDPHYENGIISHLKNWFLERIDTLTHLGIRPEKIILDPGIGFGKTVADNVKIIHNLPELKKLGFRLLLGASRKSFLGKILNQPTQELLPATLAVNTLACVAGVDIIRVHDIKEHRAIVDLIDTYTKQQ